MLFQLKNWIPIISAFLLFLVQILFLKEIFQFIIANLIGVDVSILTFIFPSLSFNFEPNPDTLLPFIVFMYLAPLIYLIISIEFTSLFLKKSTVGIYRYFLLIFILLQLGYLLIKIFYNAVILILNPGLKHDWIAMSIAFGFGDFDRIIFSFAIIFLFVFYLNISIKRVTSYIN